MTASLDTDLARWFASELQIDYSAKDTPERFIDRMLLQKTLHFANCYFFCAFGNSLLKSKETKGSDGPLWREIHNSLKEKAPANSLFDFCSFVPTLKIIAKVCKSFGAERLKAETYKTDVIKEAREGDEIAVAALDFPTTDFEKDFFACVSNQVSKLLDEDSGPQCELTKEDYDFKIVEIVY